MAVRSATPLRQSDTAKTGAGVGTVASAAEAELVPANPNRAEVTVCNKDATNFISLALGTTAILGRGITVQPKSSYTTAAFTGAIRAIASTADCAVSFTDI